MVMVLEDGGGSITFNNLGRQETFIVQSKERTEYDDLPSGL